MPKLNFKYCECGCKSYKASVGNLHFKIFWDLGEAYSYWGPENPFPNKPIECSSYEEAVKLAKRRIAKEIKILMNSLLG